MYYLLSLLTGILISVMVAINGGLTNLYGVYPATVIIHFAGLALIAAILAVKRDNPFARRHEWYLYTGGAIGVATTVFNNMAFGRISVSSILAIGLFAQSLAGLVIDQYALMGCRKYPFSKRKIAGLLLVFCGIVYMTDKFDAVAVAVSFASGITIIVSRTINARLSELSSVKTGAFYNYLVGFMLSIPLCFLFGAPINYAPLTPSPELYIYTGGLIGVGVILLSNVTVMKVSAFYLSLFLFVGQVFAGILTDAFISQAFSQRILIGGILVTAGLLVNLLLDRRQAGEEPE